MGEGRGVLAECGGIYHVGKEGWKEMDRNGKEVGRGSAVKIVDGCGS